MAESVGSMLGDHASALTGAVGSLIHTAIENDNYAKDQAIERTRKTLAFPPTRMAQHILYQEPGEDGTPQNRIIKFDLLIPTFIMMNNEPIVITKYYIKSTFEASIKKATNIKSETEVSGGGSVGFLGLPSFNFDISEKLTVGHDSESSQHNTFDLEVEMGQGDPSLGYSEIVKAFVRCVNRVVDFICQSGLQNPTPIDESEAKKLNEQADVPITDFDATKDEGSSQPTETN